ncbi:MAG: hypothetical protein K2K37_01870 [Muribaculaceae bacterium]|nr:hypothetical protein [Muribaculaceae bacterium]
MKKTTYILLGLIALIFVAELAFGIYLYATRIPVEEFEEMHPEWYRHETVSADDFNVQDTDAEESEPIVIDAADSGLEVVVTSDDYRGVEATTYYTDTLIITSPRKNIRVTSMLR